MNRIPFIFAATIVSGLAAAPVRAESLKLDFVNVQPGLSVSFTLNGGNPTSTTAGVYRWRIDTDPDGGVTPYGNHNDIVKTFCIELLQNTGDNVLFDIVPLKDAPDPGEGTGGPGLDGGMGAVKAAQLQALWGTHRAKVDDQTDSLSDNVAAAAFQMAVWEIVFDAGLSLTSGDFKASTGNALADSTAQVWLNSLTDNSVTLVYESRLMALSNDQQQDQLIVNPVPAPPAIVLAGIGFLGLFGYRLRNPKRFSA